MSPYIKSALFLNKYSLLKSNAQRYFQELLVNQNLTSEELEKLNWNRTKKLLEYSYDFVPYYTKRFKDIVWIWTSSSPADTSWNSRPR